MPYNCGMNKSKIKQAPSSLLAMLVAVAVLVCFAFAGLGCSGQQGSASSAKQGSANSAISTSASRAFGSELAAAEASVSEDGLYTSKFEVAAYIHLYGHLPGNYVSKTKARKAGWVPSKGNLQDVLPDKSIGGSEFYNDEGRLPEKSGRKYTECDIDYNGGTRGAKRIVFSDDGLVFYTADHYETFEQLY